MEPVSLVGRVQPAFPPVASADKAAGRALPGEGAEALTELMKARPLGSMSMSSEPVSARQTETLSGDTQYPIPKSLFFSTNPALRNVLF